MTKADIIRVLLGIKSARRAKIARFVNTTRSYVNKISYDLRRNGQKKYKLTHTDKRNKQRNRNYLKGRKHDINSRKLWTDEEKKVIKLSSDKKTDRKLAKEIGRSVQAIQIKRCKDKKLEVG